MVLTCNSLTTWHIVRESYKSSLDMSVKGKKRQDPLHKFEFLRVVLDECTTMKTHTSHIAKACCALLAWHHWLISGTLIHDNLQEPYSYLKFLKLPDMEDIRNYNTKFLTKTVSATTGRTRKGHVARPELGKQMKDLMIRRTATTTIAGEPILVLPKVTYTDILVSCRPYEQRLHDNLAAEVGETIYRILKALERGKLKEEDAKRAILRQITRRRLAASHPYLIAPDLSRLLKRPHGVDKLQDPQAFNAFMQECSDDPRTMVDPEMLARTCKVIDEYEDQRDAKGKKMRFPLKHFLKDNSLSKNAKVRSAEDKLKEWMTDDPTRKIIVFSIYILELKIIEHICQTKGWNVKIYHGGMSQRARNKSLKKFREDPQTNILLSSLGAGGMGLNLVHASRCLIVDLHWNVSLEEQAMARVYRLGQKREVEIARIVADGTFDVELLVKQQRKSANIASILNSKEFAKSSSLMEMLELAGWTKDDLKDLKNDQTSVDEKDFINDSESDDDDDEALDDEEHEPKKQTKNQKAKKKTATKAPAMFPESSDEESSDDDDEDIQSDAGNTANAGGDDLNDDDMNHEQASYDDIEQEEDDDDGPEEDDIFATLYKMKTEV